MAAVFHWVKVRLFCYATEDEERLRDVIVSISGTDDISEEISEGHHGNDMIILTADLKGSAECRELFKRLGKDVIDEVLSGLEDRMDDDCTFYLRVDKQAAVSGAYEIAHHGDVVSITCKVAAHPAKKDIALGNMQRFLEDILRGPF
ncbi:MAG: exosome protein [Methanomassiliicoccaceae archaeon]|nr:exosome protein [Methanomassiliicoccaceae archaeon]